jgi:POT family proton-dependent oligopeptide transporter
LGYKQAVVIGGSLILTGHLLLTFSDFFFASLGCIIAGSAIFRVSVQTLVGLVGDPKGFTLFYVGMNLGGVLAAVLCGVVAQTYGWHAGFGLAALGMAIGLSFFLAKSRLFDPLMKPQRALVEKRSKLSYSIALSLLLLVAFSTVEELWGSLLMLFSEHHINRVVFGLTLPSATLAATNPLVIILLGPLLARLEIRYEAKLLLGFLSLGLAFFLLHAAALMPHPSVFYLITGLSAIAIGEVLLVPAVLDFVSKSAPGSGAMMGATIVALSVGTLLSGVVAQIPCSAGSTFLGIGCGALAIALVIFFKAYKKISPV